MRSLLLILLSLSCGPEDPGSGEQDSDSDAAIDGWPVGVWNPSLPATDTLTAPRGHRWLRAGIHLHAPFSHDACDGLGWQDGDIDTVCEASLYAALCTVRYDVAFITDHPDYGDRVSVDARWPPDAAPVVDEDGFVGVDLPCEGGHRVHARAGFEDTLMPVGLRRDVHADLSTRHDLLKRSDRDSFDAMHDAGGVVLLAHTEGRTDEDLARWQGLGLHGVEAYNVHAAFAPNIRRDHLGLDANGWVADIGPFVQQAPGLAPDLLFLAVLSHQRPSLDRWDRLLERGAMMISFGSDAHENVLPAPLADGERVDSYRRVLRWGSTWLLADGDDPASVDRALQARRAHVVAEILGTPAGLDLHVVSEGGEVVEVGSEGAPGELVVGCPTLADGSPRGSDDPEIAIRVLRDGQPWREGCGRWPVGPGVYRAEIEMIPRHLEPFLGEGPGDLMRPYPWIYTGAVRVSANLLP